MPRSHETIGPRGVEAGKQSTTSTTARNMQQYSFLEAGLPLSSTTAHVPSVGKALEQLCHLRNTPQQVTLHQAAQVCCLDAAPTRLRGAPARSGHEQMGSGCPAAPCVTAAWPACVASTLLARTLEQPPGSLKNLHTCCTRLLQQNTRRVFGWPRHAAARLPRSWPCRAPCAARPGRAQSGSGRQRRTRPDWRTAASGSSSLHPCARGGLSPMWPSLACVRSGCPTKLLGSTAVLLA